MKKYMVCVLLVVFVCAFAASTWAGTKSSGLTSYDENWIDALTVQLTLYNNTDFLNPEIDNGKEYVVLVSEFNVGLGKNGIADTDQPSDWTFKNGQFEIKEKNRKYYIPPTLGPGQSMVFTLVFQSTATIPSAWNFETHVLAVGTEALTSNGKYLSVRTSNGETWWDKPTPREIDPPVPAVPEASTLVGFGTALVMTGPAVASWFRRRKY